MKKALSILAFTVMVFQANLVAFAADTENPSAVENLDGTALDGAVSLSWDPATDDTGVTGYQIHYGLNSVTEAGQSYDEVVDVGDVTSKVIEGLENGTTYYFSAIAYDEAGNESLEWAREFSVTPDAAGGEEVDSEAPQVMSATALNKEEVSVVFSEGVVLPEENPQEAFFLESQEDFSQLNVTDAVIDEEDPAGKTVILSTDPQTADIEYKITVSIDVEDLAQNPIISGTSDTAIFTGSAEEKLPDDVDGPEVVDIEEVDNTSLIVTFNETIVIEGVDIAANFSIVNADDPADALEVQEVSLQINSEGVEDSLALIKTAPQEEGKSYILVVSNVTDEAGNMIKIDKSSGTFVGVGTGVAPGDDDDDVTPGDDDDDVTPGDDDDDDTVEPDVVPPAEIANFMVNAVFEASKYTVNLTWTVPAATDSVEQLIYRSQDSVSYSQETSLEPGVTNYQVKGLSPGEYWFKITQKDAAGNESAGVVKKITLTETGPEMLGLVFLSLGLGRVVTRKKRK